MIRINILISTLKVEDKSLFQNQTNYLKDILQVMVTTFKGHRIWQSEILFGTSIAQSSGLKSRSASSILLHDRPEIRYDILHVVVSGLL